MVQRYGRGGPSCYDTRPDPSSSCALSWVDGTVDWRDVLPLAELLMDLSVLSMTIEDTVALSQLLKADQIKQDPAMAYMRGQRVKLLRASASQTNSNTLMEAIGRVAENCVSMLSQHPRWILRVLVSRDSDLLQTVICPTGGQVLVERPPTFDPSRLIEWRQSYPFAYATDEYHGVPGMELDAFKQTMGSIEISTGNYEIVHGRSTNIIVSDPHLAQVPPNLWMVGGEPAGLRGPVVWVPSISWLEQVLSGGKNPTVSRIAWFLPFDPQVSATPLAILYENLVKNFT